MVFTLNFIYNELVHGELILLDVKNPKQMKHFIWHGEPTIGV